MHKCVNHAVSDFNLPIFSDREIETLNNLSDTLEPLDLAINELSKDSTTLIEFECVIKFLFNKLSKANNSLLIELVDRLKYRPNERRTKVLNTLILYLNSGTFPTNNMYFKYSTKSETR